MDQKTKQNHMLPPGDTSQLQRQIWTQSERMENDISSKWHSEKSGSSSTNTGRNRLQNKKGKEIYREYRETLYNDKLNHTPRRHNTY